VTEERHAWEAGAHDWVELARNNPDGPRLAHDESIRSLLPPPRGLTLDVGCGEGRWTRELRERGYEAVGLDRSEKLLEEARAADPDGRYELAEAGSLPVEAGGAQLVLCVNVLMHVVDLDAVVREFARALARGGAAVLGLTHPVMEAGTFDEEANELRLHDYFAAEEHAIPLGHGHVFHQHRTIEQYVRPFLGAGFVLDGLCEIPGRTGTVPRFLDLRFRKGA
jgi:ubiquinone/menaquinone biosynthesis C-methylase UbiE